MYYDSFFFRVIPILAEHFHQGVLVQNYTGGGLWNLSWVDERKPDVVIIEFNERYLEDLPQFYYSRLIGGAIGMDLCSLLGRAGVSLNRENCGRRAIRIEI